MTSWGTHGSHHRTQREDFESALSLSLVTSPIQIWKTLYQTLYHGSWTLNTVHSSFFSLCLLWSLFVSLLVSLPSAHLPAARHIETRHLSLCSTLSIYQAVCHLLYQLYIYIMYIYIYLSCHFSQVFLQAYFEINGSSSLQKLLMFLIKALQKELQIIEAAWQGVPIHLNLRVVPIQNG